MIEFQNPVITRKVRGKVFKASSYEIPDSLGKPRGIRIESRYCLHAMPRQALLKARSGIFVCANEMSDLDRLAEKQLKKDMTPQELSDILNDIALGNPSKPVSVVVSPTKRKRIRDESSGEKNSPNKRVRESKSGKEGQNLATLSSPTSKKLGRPPKNQQSRHMINTLPAVRKSKGNIWDPEDAAGEELPSTSTAAKKVPKSKKGKHQKAMVVPASDPSSLAATSSHTTQRHTRANAAKDPRSALSNDRIDLTKKPGSKTGKGRRQAELSGEEPSLSPNQDRALPIPPEAVPTGENPSSTVQGTAKRSQTTTSHEDNNLAEDDAIVESEGSESEDTGNSEDAENDLEEAQEEPQTERPDHDSLSRRERYNEALLGQGMNWEKVLKSARTVRKARVKPITETVKKLSLDIKSTRQIYKQLKDSGNLDDDTIAELRDGLDDRLESIREQIAYIIGRNEPSKKSALIGDIYGRAIPAMVYLLDAAFDLYISRPSGISKYPVMEKVIQLQDGITDLCLKARESKIRPNTDQPIVKPTSAVIFPYVRDMRKYFLNELHELWKQQEREEDRERTRQKDERLKRSRGEVANSQQGETRRRRILQSIHEEQERLRKDKEEFQNKNMRSFAVLQYTPASREWTREMVAELVVRLHETRYEHGAPSFIQLS